MTADVIPFPTGRRPLGYEECVAALDLAVAERRARPGTIYLLFGTPGSKHCKSIRKDVRGRVLGPTLSKLRDELAKCLETPDPGPESTP
jgi:hypothetical protein